MLYVCSTAIYIPDGEPNINMKEAFKYSHWNNKVGLENREPSNNLYEAELKQADQHSYTRFQLNMMG